MRLIWILFLLVQSENSHHPQALAGLEGAFTTVYLMPYLQDCRIRTKWGTPDPLWQPQEAGFRGALNQRVEGSSPSGGTFLSAGAGRCILVRVDAEPIAIQPLSDIAVGPGERALGLGCCAR